MPQGLWLVTVIEEWLGQHEKIGSCTILVEIASLLDSEYYILVVVVRDNVLVSKKTFYIYIKIHKIVPKIVTKFRTLLSLSFPPHFISYFKVNLVYLSCIF